MTGEHAVAPALLEAVREDSRLTPEEKETTLRFSKRDDAADMYTAEAGLTRRVLAHPHIQIEGVTVADEDTRREATPEEYQTGDIVGVRARVPVEVLSVRSVPRTASNHAPIISDRVLDREGES